MELIGKPENRRVQNLLERKINRDLFCISLDLHYLCTQNERKSKKRYDSGMHSADFAGALRAQRTEVVRRQDKKWQITAMHPQFVDWSSE